MTILNILLQAAPQGGGGMNWILLGAIVLIFYFFMINPQRKKAKLQAKFIEELQKGDKVVTNSGIHGKIVELTDKTVVIQSLETKIKMDKSSISSEASQLLNNNNTKEAPKKEKA